MVFALKMAINNALIEVPQFPWIYQRLCKVDTVFAHICSSSITH